MTASEWFKLSEKVRSLHFEGTKCGSCGTKLRFVTGRQVSPKGLVCDDCYYGMMSDEIEAHPVGHLGRHGG